jgi:hypothetical protein
MLFWIYVSLFWIYVTLDLCCFGFMLFWICVLFCLWISCFGLESLLSLEVQRLDITIFSFFLDFGFWIFVVSARRTSPLRGGYCHESEFTWSFPVYKGLAPFFWFLSYQLCIILFTLLPTSLSASLCSSVSRPKPLRHSFDSSPSQRPPSRFPRFDNPLFRQTPFFFDNPFFANLA